MLTQWLNIHSQGQSKRIIDKKEKNATTVFKLLKVALGRKRIATGIATCRWR